MKKLVIGLLLIGVGMGLYGCNNQTNIKKELNETTKKWKKIAQSCYSIGYKAGQEKLPYENILKEKMDLALDII